MKDLKTRIAEKLKSPGFEDHRVPVTRRDFMKLGLIAGGGMITPLSFMERAFAQATNSTIPFLVFDLEGGAAMPGNFLVGQKGGPEDLCAKYNQHGWDPRASDSLDKTFGLPMSRKASKMLEGIKAALPTALTDENQQNFKMSSLATFTLNDTINNAISALHLVSKAGLRGSYVKNGLSMFPRSINSGGNSEALMNEPRFRPRLVENISAVTALTSYGQKFEALPSPQRRAIFEQLKKYAADMPILRDIYEELSQSGLSEPKLDPRQNPQIARLYGISPSDNSPAALEAAIVYNVLMGHSGPGALTFTGCDYHDRTRNTGDNLDLIIGRSIGRAVHAASLLKKPLFFQIITDGGVTDSDPKSSSNYERIWVADENLHSLSVIGYFDPNQPVKQRQLQIGHYNAKGEIELETPVGRKTDSIGKMALANYLNVGGQMNRMNSIIGSAQAEQDAQELLVFG